MPVVADREPAATGVVAAIFGVGEPAAATRRTRIDVERQVCEIDNE